MAAISTILSGVLSFVTALVGLVFFHLSALQALSVWSGTGIVVLVALTLLVGHARQSSTLSHA